MTLKMIAVIESKLRVEWSPQQISGWLLNDQERLISYEGIYIFQRIQTSRRSVK
ncbi:MAG: hypothetical protein QS721_12195 [Candidatus Endonucleobacter sp. (ex Gigantidas childressi)]|nr:hypothetical protein [Candidatus Endonucleobacter sp. (ex Gigantidas childressi)]